MGYRYRRLKVYYGYQIVFQSTYQRIPYIRLKGKWLRKNGFEIGDALRVIVREGLIVIERVEDDSNPKT